MSGERKDGRRGRNSPVLEQKRNIEITISILLMYTGAQPRATKKSIKTRKVMMETV